MNEFIERVNALWTQDPAVHEMQQFTIIVSVITALIVFGLTSVRRGGGGWMPNALFGESVVMREVWASPFSWFKNKKIPSLIWIVFIPVISTLLWFMNRFWVTKFFIDDSGTIMFIPLSNNLAGFKIVILFIVWLSLFFTTYFRYVDTIGSK